MTDDPIFSRVMDRKALSGIDLTIDRESRMGGISNRMKEIKRRRHRRHKLVKFHSKLKKATTSEKLVMAQKLRKMTTGCNTLILQMGLEERKRG